MKMVSSFNKNSINWSTEMTSRIEAHFFTQMTSLYKKELSRNTKYMGSLVRLYLELLKVDESIRNHLPEWLFRCQPVFEVSDLLEEHGN